MVSSKKEVYNKEEAYRKKFEKSKELFNNSTEISQVNKDYVNNYVHIASIHRKNKLNKCYSYNATRYDVMLTLCRDIFKDRDLNSIERSDMEKLSYDLEADIILKKNGTPYAESYKAKISKILMEFYKYHFGRNKERFQELFISDYGTTILNTSTQRYKKKPIINYLEAKKIVEEAKSIEEAFMFAVLFDGGFRIGEFLSITLKDIIKKKGDNQDYFIITVITEKKAQKEPRSVALYSFSNTIDAYIEKVKREGIDESTPLFPYQPQTTNRWVKSNIKNILKKKDYSLYKNHSLRHSSATHYACNVAKNDISLYLRFGWSYGSDEAKEYVQMIHAKNTQEEERFRQSNVYEETGEYKEEINTLKEEFNKVKEDNNRLKEEFNETFNDVFQSLEESKKDLANYHKILDSFQKAIKEISNPKVAQKFEEEYIELLSD